MQTRKSHSEHYAVITTRTDIYRHSFFNSTIPLWNQLPSPVVTLPSTKAFSIKIQEAVYSGQPELNMGSAMPTAGPAPSLQCFAPSVTSSKSSPSSSSSSIFQFTTISAFLDVIDVILFVQHRMWPYVMLAPLGVIPDDGLPRNPVEVEVEVEALD